MGFYIMIGQFQVPVDAEGGWIPFGQGTSGLVTRAQDITTGAFIALKIIPVKLREEDGASVLHQLQALYASRHPCVVEFFGADYFPARESFLIATEYMDLTSFKDVMQFCGPVPEQVLGYATRQIVEGLLYLHRERRLIHRDVKPSNLLLNSKGGVKISDFGMSTQLAKTLDPANTWVGSTTYMSPERISGLQYVGNSDIWSLGISLVELAMGTYPYSSGNPGKRLELVDLLDRIVDEEPPSLPADRATPEFRDFVALCLKKRVEERPHADTLLGHPWCLVHTNTRIDQWLQTATDVISAGQAQRLGSLVPAAAAGGAGGAPGAPVAQMAGAPGAPE